MSYWDISQMAADLDLQARIRACAAQEGAAVDMLKVCAAPGWDAAWASAAAAGVQQPGRDAGVISDEMILSSVQAQAAP